MSVLIANVPWSSQSQDRVESFVTPHAEYIVLADGAGGTSGGAEAAEHFVRRVREIATASSCPDVALSSLSRLDLEMEAAPDCGESTGVVVALTATEIRCASVGDSEAWLIRDGRVDAITEGQRRKPLLGSGAAMPAQAVRPRGDGGALLVASDGLFRYASREKILAALTSVPPPSTLEALVNLVRLRSGHLQDDISVALFWI